MIGTQNINTQPDVIAALNTAEPGSRMAASPYAHLHTIEEHLHSSSKVYPTGADGVTLTCGDAAAWTLGSFVEIVPASTITDDFDIHFIVLEAISAAGTYELVLYAGEVEILRTRVTAVGTPNNIALLPMPVISPIQAANTQIQGKIMSSTGVANTMKISLEYHTY